MNLKLKIHTYFDYFVVNQKAAYGCVLNFIESERNFGILFNCDDELYDRYETTFSRQNFTVLKSIIFN